MKSLLCALFLMSIPLSASAEFIDFVKPRGTVPRAAEEVASQIDSQLMRHIGTAEGGRSNVLIISTVAVSLSNLDESSPLSRQFSEEVITALFAKGYRVNELRKGKEIVMHPVQGETILTRKLSQLASRDVSSVAVLAGTYVTTSDNVRFTMRLLSSPSNEVLATGAATVPVTNELIPLLSDKKTGPPKPSVFTQLP